MPPTQNDIPFYDWNEDIAATLALQSRLGPSNPDADTAFQNLFERRYPNPAIRFYRRNRVEAALRWFEKNLPELEETWPDDIVSGGGAGMLSSRVVIALHAIYSRCPEEHLHDNHPISFFEQGLPSKQ